MRSCSPRRPMRWSGAIDAIARCKRVSTEYGRKHRSVRVLRSICGVKRKPKAANKPWPYFILRELDKPGSSATVSKDLRKLLVLGCFWAVFPKRQRDLAALTYPKASVLYGGRCHCPWGKDSQVL